MSRILYKLIKYNDIFKRTHYNRNLFINCIDVSNRHSHNSSSSVFHKYKKIMEVPAGLFQGSSDRFNGVTVDSVEENDGNLNFVVKLEKSLASWAESKRRGIWFKVHTLQSDWIPHLVKNGFDFHHAKEGFVVLYRWLPTNEPVNIPVYAHTMIGVGGVVVNDKNEVLVVSERFSLIPNSWKLPGGYVEPKENLIDAVIREVREETGIETKFETVISFRHSHGGGYNCSDIYIVIGLKPTTTELVRCEREIAKVQWMPVAEYLEHPNVHETNREFLRKFLVYQENGIRIDCETKSHPVLKKEYKIYFVKKND